MKVRRILLVVLATALLFELSLQVLSFGNFLRLRSSASDSNEREEGTRLALCVGDSYTYGYGSSDPSAHSYPARLEVALEEGTSEAWKVVNLGWPGNNTEQMAATIAPHLHQPADLVVILGGINDPWSDPQPFDFDSVTVSDADSGETSASPPFRWELRTLRLFRTGTQHNPYQSTDAGNEHDPSATAPSLEESQPEKEKAEPELPAESLSEQGWRLALEDQNFEAAAAVFESIPAGDPSRSPGLCFCYTALQQHDQVDDELELLREAFKKDPSESNAAVLINCLTFGHRNGEIVEWGKNFAEDYPTHFGIAYRYGLALLHAGSGEESRDWFDRARDLLSEDEVSQSDARWFWTNRAIAYGEHSGLSADPEEMYFSVISSYLAGKSEGETQQSLLSMAPYTTEESWKGALARVSMTEEQKTALNKLYARSEGDTLAEAVGAATRENYENMARRAKATGAVVLICTYPFRNEFLETVGKEASTRTKTFFLRVDDDFERALALNDFKKETLFVSDGHCNDAGYQLLANLIAEKVMPALLDRKTP